MAYGGSHSKAKKAYARNEKQRREKAAKGKLVEHKRYIKREREEFPRLEMIKMPELSELLRDMNTRYHDLKPIKSKAKKRPKKKKHGSMKDGY